METNSLKELPWRLFAAIILLWLLVGLLPYALSGDLSIASNFANTFGFVNALFAALAFGGVIWAIRLQTNELELQRLEIEETRDELRRSADAQQQSQQMHFLSALLLARNNVAQGYAAVAARETGALRASHLAHRQQLAELEWLLHRVDQLDCNPFALPAAHVLVAHQIGLLLARSHPILRSALDNRAANHARSILTDLNQSLRDLCRLLVGEDAATTALKRVLSDVNRRAELVNDACGFEEVAAVCETVFQQLRNVVDPVFQVSLADLRPREGVLSDCPPSNG